jgi:hypothetical protein
MLYKFKSRAVADLILLEPQAQQILQIIGKAPGATGIVTVAQIPAAVAALEAAVAADEARVREAKSHAHAHAHASTEGADAADEAAQADAPEAVRLHQRAAPFLDMLRRSAQEGCDVVWGV